MSKTHKFGCECDKETAHSFYADGSPAPCPPEVPCATASAEWNAVRARFAIADEIRSVALKTGRSADALERLVSDDGLLGGYLTVDCGTLKVSVTREEDS